ncbi:adenylate kinase [Aliikangiella sp. G2MR2-5]|uniref:adenylate kinase n=1 Tax=Aliikangiella sp. G2MR2-5 TaxID=2788943 RepID=UPI0018AB28E9|nr:adenylate kinase [Aliikangiella sp. G2MR2-5]
MKRIAVFGKPGGGKSTFSKQLAKKLEVSLYPLDLFEYLADGTRVDAETYKAKHDEIIQSQSWIIEGLGTFESFYQRLDAADTLIYIDLPYSVHYRWVIKRFVMSLFRKPEGWPEGSNVFKGTVASLKTLKLCPKFWNEKFLNDLYEKYLDKNIFVIRSVSALNAHCLEFCLDVYRRS